MVEFVFDTAYETEASGCGAVGWAADLRVVAEAVPAGSAVGAPFLRYCRRFRARGALGGCIYSSLTSGAALHYGLVSPLCARAPER